MAAEITHAITRREAEGGERMLNATDLLTTLRAHEAHAKPSYLPARICANDAVHHACGSTQRLGHDPKSVTQFFARQARCVCAQIKLI
jgi:hypothetical protein